MAKHETWPTLLESDYPRYKPLLMSVSNEDMLGGVKKKKLIV